jgi:hypothetical protein
MEATKAKRLEKSERTKKTSEDAVQVRSGE